jgi:hypothetical protein
MQRTITNSGTQTDVNYDLDLVFNAEIPQLHASEMEIVNYSTAKIDVVTDARVQGTFPARPESPFGDLEFILNRVTGVFTRTARRGKVFLAEGGTCVIRQMPATKF